MKAKARFYTAGRSEWSEEMTVDFSNKRQVRIYNQKAERWLSAKVGNSISITSQ